MKAMTLRMSDEMWAVLEDCRGSEPRERWVRDTLVQCLVGMEAFNEEYQLAGGREHVAALLPEQTRYFKSLLER